MKFLLKAGLVCLSLGLLITAAVTRRWSCGNLYADCYDKFNDHPAGLSTLILFSAGVFLIAMVTILDILSCCLASIRLSKGVRTTRIILLSLSVPCLISAMCLFTNYMLPTWSYTAAVVGTALAIQVAILTAII